MYRHLRRCRGLECPRALNQCRAALRRRQARRPRLARGTALKGGNGELRGKRPLYNHSNTRTLKLASLGVITLFVVGPQLFEVVSLHSSSSSIHTWNLHRPSMQQKKKVDPKRWLEKCSLLILGVFVICLKLPILQSTWCFQYYDF